jgi:2-polyprenyl-6-methoxyphenol hydroxylase-like FAD-dependent oxidoreductase
MWDVIVVGARCAGAAIAIRFARSGRSVLMVDKTRPGAETLSSHVLVAPAIGRFKDLGLLKEVCGLGAPPVHTFLVEYEGRSYPCPIQGYSNFILCIRRTALDPLLVQAAEQAGVTVRYQLHVDDLLWEGEQVVGVRYREPTGEYSTERARLVVGADGRHSCVARLAQATEYNSIDCENGLLYAYFQGIGPSVAGDDVLQVASGPECDALCCPCDGDLHIVQLNVHAEEFVQINAQGVEAYEERLRTIPALAPRLKRAQRVSRLHPATPRELRGYFRHPYGPGWVLVGDSGYCAHPAPANGIADALRSAEVVHSLVERAWAEGQPATTHLRDYQIIRDAENTKTFYFSYRLGKVNPFTDPEVAAIATRGQSRGQR